MSNPKPDILRNRNKVTWSPSIFAFSCVISINYLFSSSWETREGDTIPILWTRKLRLRDCCLSSHDKYVASWASSSNLLGPKFHTLDLGSGATCIRAWFERHAGIIYDVPVLLRSGLPNSSHHPPKPPFPGGKSLHHNTPPRTSILLEWKGSL